MATTELARQDAMHARGWPARIIGLPDRLPMPRAVAYLVLLASSALVGVLLGWLLEPERAGEAFLEYAYYGVVPAALLCVMHDLDHQAVRAFDVLSPMLTFDEGERVAVRQGLVHLPSVPVLVSAVASLVLTLAYYQADPVTTGVEGLSMARYALRWFWESLTGAMFIVLALHTFLQLRTIDWIHRWLRPIDLFDQARARAFSTVTSRTGIALVLISSPTTLLLPSEGDLSVMLVNVGWWLSVVVVALAAFVLPLWRVRSQIAARKAELEAEVGRRMSAAIAASHAAIDSGDTAGVEVQQRHLNALAAQRSLIDQVSVWPWSTAASSRLVTAVLLPVCVWLLTRGLDAIV